MGGNRDQTPLRIIEIDPPFVSIMTVNDQIELLTEEAMIRMENPEALFRTDVGSAVDLLKDRPFQSFQRAEMSGQIRRLANNTFPFFPMARFSLAKAALLISASPAPQRTWWWRAPG